MKYKQRVGARGERIAEWFLAKQGYETLDKHVTSRFGELDLVMNDQGCMVFVEVKYRRGEGGEVPEEAVGYAKMQKTMRAAQSYAAQYRTEEYRIDVVAISEQNHRKSVIIRHHKAVSDN